MRVKVLKVDPKATLPIAAHNSDYCMDLTAYRVEKISDNIYKYYLGIAVQVDRGWESEEISPSCKKEYEDFDLDIPATYLDMKRSPLKLAIKIYPRSSVHKHGMILMNSVGIVDEGYTGEISAVFYHLDPSLPAYEVGEKVCQMSLEASFPMDLSSAVYLEPTDRGDNGYGSSGK